MTTENTTVTTPQVEVTPDSLWATDAKDFNIPDEVSDESTSGDTDEHTEEVGVEEEAEELEESSEGEEDSGKDEGESEEVQAKGDISARKYRATKSDGTQVEVDSDTVFKIKVNGKITKVNFEDLKKDYNGKVYYDERIRRASEKEMEATKLLEKERTQTENFERKLKSITKNVTSANVLDALADIGSLVGEDPDEFRASMLNGMTKFIEEFANMTPTEQNAYLANRKYEALKKERELEKAEVNEKTSKEQVVTAVEKACKDFNIARDVMEDAYGALKEDYVKRGADPLKITLDNVVDLALTFRVNENLKQAQEEFGQELGYETFNKLRNVIFEQEKSGIDLELSDYVDIIKELTVKGSKMKASAGLQKKITAPVAKKTPKSDDETPMDLNDIWG